MSIPPVHASLCLVYPKVLQFWNFLTSWATNLMAKAKTDGSIVNSGAGLFEARLYRCNG